MNKELTFNKELKSWFYIKYLNFKYRKYSDDICCCGSTIEGTWCSSPWPCRSQKEYTIALELSELKNKDKGDV